MLRRTPATRSLRNQKHLIPIRANRKASLAIHPRMPASKNLRTRTRALRRKRIRTKNPEQMQPPRLRRSREANGAIRPSSNKPRGQPERSAARRQVLPPAENRITARAGRQRDHPAPVLPTASKPARRGRKSRAPRRGSKAPQGRRQAAAAATRAAAKPRWPRARPDRHQASKAKPRTSPATATRADPTARARARPRATRKPSPGRTSRPSLVNLDAARGTPPPRRPPIPRRRAPANRPLRRRKELPGSFNQKVPPRRSSRRTKVAQPGPAMSKARWPAVPPSSARAARRRTWMTWMPSLIPSSERPPGSCSEPCNESRPPATAARAL